MERIKKVLMTKQGKRFFARNTNSDLHTQFGFIKKSDLSKKSGSKVVSNTKMEFAILTPSFIDI